MAEPQQAPDIIEEMELSQVLPHLKEFIFNLLTVFTDIEEENFTIVSKTDKFEKNLMGFLENTGNLFLIFIFDPKTSKLKVVPGVTNLKTGQAVMVFKKSPFTFLKESSPQEVLRTNVHVINIGEIESEFNPVTIAYTCLKNGLGPLLKSSEEGKEKLKQDPDAINLASKFLKSQATINMIHSRFADLSFYMVQSTALKVIPEVAHTFDPYIVQACSEAAKKGRQATVEDIPEDLAKKDSWISTLHERIMTWSGLIEMLQKHCFEVTFESLSQEIEYWGKYKTAVMQVYTEIKRPEVALIMKVIQPKQRNKEIIDFGEVLGFPKHVETVNSINMIIKDIQIDRLESAKSIPEISNAMINIFNQIKKLFDNHSYKNTKIGSMLLNFSHDLTNKIISFFQPLNIIKMPVKEFDAIVAEHTKLITGIFSQQNNQMKTYLNQSSSNQTYAPSSSKLKFNKLNERLKSILTYKSTQESFQKIIQQINTQEEATDDKSKGFGLINEVEIQEMFENTFNNNIYDLSPEGDANIEASKKIYDDKIDAIEKQIIIKIRGLLGSAKNHNEMFLVFSKFSEILKRPQFQVSLSEYQDQFLKKVFENSAELYSKYKRKTAENGSKDICRYYGIYQNTGNLIRFEQIYNHFSSNKAKIETVMGDKFKNTQKEQELESINNNFLRARENEELVKKINIQDKDLDGRLLTVDIIPRTNLFKLNVNFSSENKNIIEDLRFLIKNKQYGVVNLTTVYYFKKNTLTVYLNALKLFEIVKIWNHVITKIDEKVIMLLSNQIRRVYSNIEQGLQLEWIIPTDKNQERESYLSRFLDTVLILEQAVNHVSEKLQKIDEFIKNLTNSESTFEDFQINISSIQEIIDELLLKEYTHTDQIVREINGRIERLFAKRLAETLVLWVEEFSKFKNEPRVKNKNKLITVSTIFEFSVRGTKIFIEPPIQQARLTWLNDLHSHIHKFTCQKKIIVNRYNTSDNTNTNDPNQETTDFTDLLGKMNSNILSGAYKVLHEKVNLAENYVKRWLSYEALWEINIDRFYDRFGENLKMWQQVLNEIKQGRNTFDTSQVNVNYGPVIINYKQVQNKINNMYDSLHKEVLNAFGKKFSKNMGEIVTLVTDHKIKLEKLNFSSSAELVDNISIMNFCKSNIEKWKSNIENASDIEKLLVQQKFHFSEDYKNSSSLSKDFVKFLQIYQLKNEQFDSNIESFKINLSKEEEQISKKTAEIEYTWNNKKPFSPEMNAKEAGEIITSLEHTIKENQEALQKLNQAKTLIGLTQIEGDTMNAIIDDLQTLKELWSLVQKIWEPLDVVLETPFNACNPVQQNKVFDLMSEQLQEVPQKLKSHQIIVGKRKEVQNLKKKNRLMGDIKNDAVKEQHLVEIFKKVNIKKSTADVLVKDIFNLNYEANEKVINEIVAMAQGELVLENMLKKIKEFWHEEKFQVSKYQNKIMLIKGWDDMMTRAEEDIGQLTSMKLSQHFKTFESDIKSWHEKILNVSTTLGVWMDVQRKWVYLENIFLGSSDIKSQLAAEYDRFQSIDRDFQNIMKQMATKLKILEVIISIPNLLKSLEFISETLDKLQKSLTDYLESQRQAFPRFYFVGDDDLLEIIGNSKEIANIQKYFSKMFAGINSVETEDHGDVMNCMVSKENERVLFTNKIKISNFPKINLWLSEIVSQMQISLGTQLENCIAGWKECTPKILRPLVEKYPTQTVLLAFQTYWTFLVEEQILKKQSMNVVVKSLIGYLAQMAEEVLNNMEVLTRKRYEQLITELVHKRDVSRKIEEMPNPKITDFTWCYYMRYYLTMAEKNIAVRLKVCMGNSEFVYGHEYLGITDKLVQTPLTDKCYFTLTQALWLRMGGAPFGPAGTGKTESVKALGCNIGRFVLVFNCDETFNFKAMGRIFIGLCQVGAWGCFDEFNRLEERILSAVSQTILTIQTGLRENNLKVELLGRNVTLNVNLGIFVTMNPGYAGRSNLPENLKQLFRQMAMIKPDSVLIAQVMLFSQGFKSAEELSGKVVSLFELCGDQLSSQPHYDFGLRSLKSVLNSAGSLKRRLMADAAPDTNPHSLENEQIIILRSFSDTVVPKLISDDSPLLKLLIKGIFPTANVPPIENEELLKHLKVECDKRFLLYTNEKFIEKVLQLNQILKLQHGVMLVGPTGCGKTAAWKSLLSALTKLDGIKGESYIIDPKAITKDELYGKLDNTTMEWTDGIFTYLIRRICENQRGESTKRHWIIFDGDVDPEWAENLNSVLDDNKLLTLPNGERLPILSNVKIMFEVESLKYATLATVSRCGMAWFSEDILEDVHIFHHYLMRLKEDNYDTPVSTASSAVPTDAGVLREKCTDLITKLFIREDQGKSLATIALEIASRAPHVMEYSRIRLLEALFALIRKGINKVIDMDEIKFGNYSADMNIVEKFMLNWTVFAINWSFAGDLKLAERSNYFNELRASVFELPENLKWPEIDSMKTLIDYEVRIEDGEFSLWKLKVPELNLPSEKVTNADTIIPTVDTLRHQEVLCSWLLEHRPFIICGPPGSGKTMTLMSTLKNLQDFEMIFVNFSSSTTPPLILKQFEHYCEYSKAATGITLRPRQPNKWLVVFCDEINLPDEDKYGTQFVITLLRQMTEQHGFWRCSDKQWVSLERIQFVGACNPPTDAGRHPLSPRFLRHCPLILVDFPGYDSLVQIYGTFNRAMLKRNQTIKPYADALTVAMVEYYSESQKNFTADQQAHYIYSPRDLTRWKYAINEALDHLNSVDDLIRLWAHEALRLFEDRLVTVDEKKWCQEKIDVIANRNFPGHDSQTLARPIIFSTYITKTYTSVKLDEIRNYIIGKLNVFNEEEYAVQLVVFDEVVEHIAKIDRVLRQPLGHLLLVGASGVGKTTLSRFVSWINGLKVFQIKAGRNYSLQNFDEDLRSVMKRAGCKGENITFIFDESNILSVSFMERMNALLASGEIPGLFEGDEFYALINAYKEAQGSGKVRETEDEIYQRFIKNVQKNLHVVFTMNPQSEDFSNRAGSSPAIFNRCVIDWFGDWSEQALNQVAKELTEDIVYSPGIVHAVIVELIVRIHKCVCRLNDKLRASGKKFNYMTPRDYLDFIRHFKKLAEEKRNDLTEQQTHLNNGLSSLKNTEVKVSELKINLAKYDKDLEVKKEEADKKLEIIMQQQKESNRQIEISVKLQEQIAIKQKEIDEKEVIVRGELDAVGPALENAKKAVSGIQSAQLNEIKSYAKPPEKVVLTLEAVLYIMVGKKLDWQTIKAEMSKSDFIPTILNFNVDKVNPNIKNIVRTNYLGNAEWDLDKIGRTSKAAGPLAVWLESQLKFADILNQVKPLQNQIDEMAKTGKALTDQKIELELKIKKLEESIKEFKKEYADLISMTESLKTEKKAVSDKLIKAESLLGGLKSEKDRWEKSSKEFVNQFKTLTGDVLLSSAFLAYIGFFDQFYREQLFSTWKNYLKSSKIVFTNELSVIEYLSLPSERIKWQSKGLPNDNICTQNAIILKRFNRYPLIIDPSAQAIDFIVNLYKEDNQSGDKKVEKNLIRTSFIDDSFMKQLETSLRFGLPILIQDVEKIEPILNTILNKEIIKTGGRNLIRVGDQEVDFAPDFRLFMITRNADAHFTPDLCSRVTFVNFTVTQASLENQFINIYLKNERPDVEKNRINLLKLQGEFTVQLRGLEDELLAELSKSEGTNILDNDEMIQKLETIKKQSTEIEAEKAESEVNLEKNTLVTEQYRKISSVSSKLFFLLENMSQISTLYQFSLKFYMKIIFQILQSNTKLESVPRSEYEQRINTLDELIYMKIYEKISVSILEKDKFLFSLKFLQTKFESVYPKEFIDIFRLLYMPSKLVDTTLSDDLLKGQLSKASLIKLEDLSSRDGFDNLLPHIKAHQKHWIDMIKDKNIKSIEDFSFFNLDKLEKHLEKFPHIIEATKVLLEILVFNIIRVEITYAKIKDLIDCVFSKTFLNSDTLNLQESVTEDCDCKSPIFMSSAAGFDPSGKIYELAKLIGKKYEDVALGSQEGFDLAKRVMNDAVKNGNWVILKNVHLSPSWLKELEQEMYGMNPHKSFRLFLLAEFSEKIPVTLLKQSIKFIFELPDGIKASVRRTYKLVYDQKRSDKLPFERSRLHFLLAWIHAVIMERLRYTPTGWSKKYEFSEADLRCALDIIDEYINLQGNKKNISLEDIPFEALQSIITENIYGGKIDNQYDLKILQSIVYQYLNPDSFDPKKSLVLDRQNPVLNPDGVNFSDFKTWVENLEKDETPVWAGLPLSANDILNTQKIETLLTMFSLVQTNSDETVSLDEVQKGSAGSEKSNQLLELADRVNRYLDILPKDLKKLERNEKLISNPLFRFLEREVTVLSNLLKTVRRTLNDVSDFATGRSAPLQETKKIAANVMSNEIPKFWRKYIVPDTVTLSNWIKDLKSRIDQVYALSVTSDWQRKGLNLGELLYPEAFFTATRQYVANANGISMDELQLKVCFSDTPEVDNNSFLVNNIWIEGISWNKEGLELTNDMSTHLQKLKFTWSKCTPIDVKRLDKGEMFVPLYLNSTRRNLILSFKLDISQSSISEKLLYQRGIALITWRI